MNYDRTVSTNLLGALRSGPFAFLARIARTQHLADLQLRGYPATKRCWATLYCGLTKVLDVIERGGAIRLRGVSNRPQWIAGWEGSRPIGDWAAKAALVDEYIDGAIR